MFHYISSIYYSELIQILTQFFSETIAFVFH